MQFGREIIDERATNIAKESSVHDDDRVYDWSLAVLFEYYRLDSQTLSKLLPSSEARIVNAITNAAVLPNRMALAIRQSANIALNLSKCISGKMVGVTLAAVYLSYEIYHDIRRWWKGGISGKRCAKNVIDGIASKAAGAGGAITGAAIGTAIAPGVGTVIWGIVGGITALILHLVADPLIIGNCNDTYDDLKKDLSASSRSDKYTQALWNAIKEQNVASVELILNSVKRELGKYYLIDLLRSDGLDYSRYTSLPDRIPIFSSFNSKKMFRSVVNIVVSMTDNDMKDYEDLSTLIFHDIHTIGQLTHVDIDTLQGMLKFNRVGEFARRLSNVEKNIYIIGFHQLLTTKWLAKMDGDQLIKFWKPSLKNKRTRNAVIGKTFV